MSGDLFEEGMYTTVKYNRFGEALDPRTKAPLPVPPGTKLYPGVEGAVVQDISPPLSTGGHINGTPVKLIGVGPEVIPVQRAPEPEEIPEVSLEDLENMDPWRAMLRTPYGDIQYKLKGVDCKNPSFVVLYTSSSDSNFIPRPGQHYFLGVKAQEEKNTFILRSKVFYSGIAFKLPQDELSLLIFHVTP